MAKYWMGIVSREHVQKGVNEGFAQVCHGKKGPLTKLKKGDGFVYYSPKESMESTLACKKFTAIGIIRTGEIYQVEMFPGFNPFRIDIDYVPCNEIPILDLINTLEFTRKPHWGFILKRGLIELSAADFLTISKAMLKK